MTNLYVAGVKKGQKNLAKKIEQVFLDSTNNLFWLKKGDLVLLKPALNSPYPYPATTSPLAVSVVCNILKKRGAEVIVGDKPGMEYTIFNKGIVKGCSSRKLFEKSGMAGKTKINFIGFEEAGWDYYSKYKAPCWKNGFYATDWIKKADHIISLPRVSAHASTGSTLGFKNMVGILRDDSRVDFHQGGPFFGLIKANACRVELDAQSKPKNNLFIPKITEISLALKDKLRLTLFVADKIQATLGPDKYLLGIGKIGIFRSKIIVPETGLVFASDNQITAEAFALAFLTSAYFQVGWLARFIQKAVYFFNSDKSVKELGKEKIWQNPFIKHALKIGLNKKELAVDYQQVPIELQKQLNKLLGI